MEEKYKMLWEALVLPGDSTLDDEDDEGYTPYDEDKEPNVLQQIIGSQQNPFIQLKTYNFWTLHTNFALTLNRIEGISKILGVESMDVVSPYRVYISIGRAFDEGEIKLNIQEFLLGILNEKIDELA